MSVKDAMQFLETILKEPKKAVLVAFVICLLAAITEFGTGIGQKAYESLVNRDGGMSRVEAERVINSYTKGQLNSRLVNAIELIVEEDGKIQGYKFHGANLAGLELPPKTVLKDIELIGAEVNDAIMIDVDFDNVDFTDADIFNTNLSNSTFTRSTFNNTTFWCADLRVAKFHNTGIRRAHFLGVKLNETSFMKGWIGSVSFKDSNLKKSHIKVGTIDRISVYNSNIEEMNISSLRSYIAEKPHSFFGDTGGCYEGNNPPYGENPDRSYTEIKPPGFNETFKLALCETPPEDYQACWNSNSWGN